MPGNPLPKIDINASRWPYDENGPVNGKFGEVAVTAAPKAVFDATANPTQTLSSNGRVSFKPAVAEAQPNEVIPNFDGRRGFKFSYNGKTDPFGQNGGNEARFTLSSPDDHPYEVIQIYQPTNYTLRSGTAVGAPDAASVENWEVGDTVTSSSNNHTGVIYGKGTNPANGFESICIKDYTGHHSLNWSSGATITNDRNGESFVSQEARLIGANNKTSIWWVDDGDPQEGYSNAAYNMEVDAKDFDGNGWIAMKLSASNYAESRGTRPNELPGGLVKVFDQADNGSVITLVIERKRCSKENDGTGEFRLWKQTEREGGDYPDLTLIFQNTSLLGYTEPEVNAFTNGYLFGYANSGYAEQTDFYILKYEYWNSKPDILTEAGY